MARSRGAKPVALNLASHFDEVDRSHRVCLTETTTRRPGQRSSGMKKRRPTVVEGKRALLQCADCERRDRGRPGCCLAYSGIRSITACRRSFCSSGSNGFRARRVLISAAVSPCRWTWRSRLQKRLQTAAVASGPTTRKPPKRGLSLSGRRASNPRPSAWEADALPTELRPRQP
jgi:hypothetical protein